MNPLWTGLIDLAIRIGRWLVKRLARWARDHVVGYLRGKIADFRRRLKRKGISERRTRWLNGRIRRWTAAANWIELRAIEELYEGAKQVCKLPRVRKLPDVASCEKFVGERRAA